jgi:hypothetical protein
MKYLPLAALPLLVACATAKPQVDPVTQPTTIGAITESAAQGADEAAHGAAKGRRIGVAAGVLIAVFGGGEHDTFGDAVDRFFETVDVAETTGALIGGVHGSREGAKRGHEMDVRFAELYEIEGMQVWRPYPDTFDAYIENPAPQVLSNVAAVFGGHEKEWTIDVEGTDETALNVRDSLRELGIQNLETHRNDDVRGVALHIRYRG